MTKKSFGHYTEFGTQTKKLKNGYILIDKKGTQLTPESKFISVLHGSKDNQRVFYGDTIDNERYYCDPFGNMVSAEDAKAIEKAVLEMELYPEKILDLQKQDDKIIYLSALCFFNEMLKCDMWEYSLLKQESGHQLFESVENTAKILIKRQEKLTGFVGNAIKNLIKEMKINISKKEKGE